MIKKELEAFAQSVKQKMTSLVSGQPEDQLRSPLEILFSQVGLNLKLKVVAIGETSLPGRLGRPDYAVMVDKLLAGYIELKAPGIGANPDNFTERHNKDQWKRFKLLPNLIYCDGNEWGLYREGKLIRQRVVFSGHIESDGQKAINSANSNLLEELLTDFLSWNPIVPSNAKQLANILAPLCRMLRDDVVDALKDPNSPLVSLAKDWRQLLFPEASDAQFADSYAQTVTFALLLARSEGADTTDLNKAIQNLSVSHSLLSRALQVLTDTQAQAEIISSLRLLQRVISQVATGAMVSTKEDPWLYFYEDFLAVYDKKLRKAVGAYYTPVEVVRSQVKLVDDILKTRLGKSLGLAENDVVILDPAVGTGTYLLGVIEHALKGVADQEGSGSVPGRATTLAKNIYGFEIMCHRGKPG